MPEHRQIRERNTARKQWEEALERARKSGPLHDKIESARRYRSELDEALVAGSGEDDDDDETIVFSTAKSVLEQAEAERMKQFDARMELQRGDEDGAQ